VQALRQPFLSCQEKDVRALRLPSPKDKEVQLAVEGAVGQKEQEKVVLH
jgi:hypothetical protein